MASGTEKFSELGKSLISINETVKAAKLMAKNNMELNRIIEETKKHAEELDKIQIPKDKSLEDLQLELETLKNTAKLLFESGSRLIDCIGQLITKSNLFETLVRIKFRRRQNSAETLIEFCYALEELRQRAQKFSEEYLKFSGHLKKLEQQSNTLTISIKKKDDELRSRAGTNKKVGFGIIATAGLIALGFFTGGAACVAAGVVGSVGIAGAGAAAVVSYKKVTLLNELADGIVKCTGQLGAITAMLTTNMDKSSTFKLDDNTIDALHNALNYFIREMDERDEMEKTVNVMIAERNAEIAKRDAEIEWREAEKVEEAERTKDKVINVQTVERAKSEAEVAKKETEIAKKDAEIAKKDVEIAMKDTEIAKKDAEIARKDAEIALRNGEISNKDAEIAKIGAKMAKRSAELARAREEIRELLAKLQK